MEVFRLCDTDEMEYILKNRSFVNVGQELQIDSSKNTHKYVKGRKYMHFFDNEMSLLYLSLLKGKYICVYNIPDELLSESKGKGFYRDFISYSNLCELTEYAIYSDKIKFEYLSRIYRINEEIDFDYFPETDEIYDCLSTIYDSSLTTQKGQQILEDEER